MVSQMALADIAELRSQGIPVTDEAVIRLNALAVRAEASPGCLGVFAAPRRLDVGGVTLHEPTVQSESWMDDVAGEIASDNETWWSLMGFACGHAREPGFFESLPTAPREIRRVVKAWYSGIRATSREVTAALRYVVFGASDSAGEAAAETGLAKARREAGGAAAAETGNYGERIFALTVGARLGLTVADVETMAVSRLGRCVLAARQADGADMRESGKAALAGYFATLREIREAGLAEKAAAEKRSAETAEKRDAEKGGGGEADG